MFLTADEYLYCGAPRGRVGEEGTRVLTVCVPMLAARGREQRVKKITQIQLNPPPTGSNSSQDKGSVPRMGAALPPTGLGRRQELAKAPAAQPPRDPLARPQLHAALTRAGFSGVSLSSR